MTTRSTLKLSLFILFAGIVFSLRAGPISGSYSNDCTSLVKLWDLSGTYNSTNVDQTQTDIEMIVLNMDATGAITGSGHFDITDSSDGSNLHADFTANGKVTSAGNVVRVKLTFVAGSGTGTVQGIDVTFSAKLNENLELNDSARMLVGNSTGKLKLTAPSLGITRSKSIPSTPVTQALPDDVDGAWGLSLTTAPSGTKYTGGSTLQLSNGKRFDLGVTGSYSSKTDLSKISLKSTDKTAPINLSVVEQNLGNAISIMSIKGKALGQNLQFAQ